MSIFFTSDTHFYHANVIRHSNRPFKDVDEMNEVLVQNWNESVAPQDTVFHLGDVIWYKEQVEILKRLNGHKILILGNHDDKKLLSPYFQEVHNYLEPKIEFPDGSKTRIILFHFPIQFWNRRHHGSIHLHGHSHGACDNTGLNRFDMGVDVWDYKPVTIERVLELLPARKNQAIEMGLIKPDTNEALDHHGKYRSI